MRSCFKEVTGRLNYIPQSVGKTVNALRCKIEEVVERGGEGLVIKHSLSKYSLNERTPDWIKVKPDYIVGPHN